MKPYRSLEVLWIPMTDRDLVSTSLTVSAADYVFGTGGDVWSWQ